jgi:hypothetical protein
MVYINAVYLADDSLIPYISFLLHLNQECIQTLHPPTLLLQSSLEDARLISLSSLKNPEPMTISVKGMVIIDVFSPKV